MNATSVAPDPQTAPKAGEAAALDASPADQAWGGPPSPDYEELAAHYRPIFRRIAAGAIEREVTRALPHEPIAWLKAARFGAVRVQRAQGGSGASLPDLFALLTELSAADSNVTQALRAHFGFVEGVLNLRDTGLRSHWLERIAAGDIAGSAWTEIGPAKQAAFSTRVSRTADGWRLNGAKYYTTGSLFADWIDVGATVEGLEGSDGDGDGGTRVLVRRDAPGVQVIDDWDGFGQILTASGTATFTDVPVAETGIVPQHERAHYSSAFYQLVHLATLAGLGRAATAELGQAVAERRRSYSNAPSPRPAQDPQVLQVVGRVRSAAYAAGAIVLKAAEAQQRAYDAHLAEDDAARDSANVVAELESAQAQTIVTSLILDASTLVFDALGASATKRGLALDRFWRNARTLSSHNPRIYKDRVIGDYAVNGTLPPYQWRIGEA